MMSSSTFPGLANAARSIPVRWHKTAWSLRIRILKLQRRSRAGLRFANLLEPCWDEPHRASTPSRPRRRDLPRHHWFFSAAPLGRLAASKTARTARSLRRLTAPLRFRPLTVFNTSALNCSFVSALNQHPGL